MTLGGHVPSTRRRLNKAGLGGPPRPSHGEAGLTVVELSVVLVIIGLVMVSIIPLLQDALTVNKAKGAGEQVAAAVRLAREYAIGQSFQYNVTVASTSLTIACDTGCPSGAATEPVVNVVEDGTLTCFLACNQQVSHAGWKGLSTRFATTS